jgi:hypothetical protein
MLAGMCRTRRREQDRVMADTVTLKWLAQNKPAAKDGVIAHSESSLTWHRVPSATCWIS